MYAFHLLCVAPRPENAGGGDQAGPDGRGHGRHGRVDGQGDPGQAGSDRRGQQVIIAMQNIIVYRYVTTYLDQIGFFAGVDDCPGPTPQHLLE